MAADPDSLTFLGKVAGALAALATPVVWVHKQLGRKADKEDLQGALKHIERLYQNAEADRRLTRDLHDKAMEEIRNNQITIIGILAGRRTDG